MLDTIAIVISKSHFTITDFDLFTPNCKFLMEATYMPLGKVGVAKCYQNATKKEIKSGFYKPKLTLSRFVVKNYFDPSDDTVQEIRLHIEFSAPKLVMGQNLGELSNGDFCHVVSTLMKVLEEMGVEVFDFDSIANAWVHKIHYSKNIIFNDGTPIKFILKAIERADISRRLDAGKTDYRNEWSIIIYHTNTYELSFYDKLKDLQAGKRSDKRALEDDNGIQTHWLDKLKAEGISILRMEVRLNSKKTIQKFLEKAGIIVTDKKVAKWILKNFSKA